MKSNGMRLIMLGAPGAGKGTQANKLSERFTIPKISTGDILRDAIKNGTSLGLKAKSFMDAGQLVPDDVVIGIVEEKLNSQECASGWILDGFPRTLQQAQTLDSMLKRINTGINYVLNLDMDDEEIIKRLSGRRSCENCQSIFNIYFSIPVKDGVCDNCGGKLIQRNDDKEETVRERFRVYKEKTEPLIHYYSQQELLKKIDASEDIEVVFSKICSGIQ
ncbi:MAG: adenylate kinase [Nitrospira sp.]|nr:adenylate kinase [Nitrospira sp.]